jgi:catechol 2,3-dioxygenase-like lactoylglutathione lyase family enzyme
MSILLAMAANVGWIQPGTAQITGANTAGVAMGHLHYRVRDVEANKAFWVALGGTTADFLAGEIVLFPNLAVLISEGEPEGGTAGSVVNHVAFRVDSLAAIEAKGFELEYNAEYPGIASVFTPEGERIELFDDVLATNIGFDADPGRGSSVSERHNRPLTGAIVSHHLHLYVPEADVEAARDWYVEHFGAVPGKRWRYDAADLPGINLNFSGVASAQAPTRGRMLDHVGFEIEGLEQFCAALEAKGIELDRPYQQLPSGFGLAFLTDPWGTYIELTEGLR